MKYEINFDYDSSIILDGEDIVILEEQEILAKNFFEIAKHYQEWRKNGIHFAWIENKVKHNDEFVDFCWICEIKE